MNKNDKRWINKWSNAPYRPIVDNFIVGKAYIPQFEPISSIQMATYSEAMGNHFKEGMIILDYGCRTGRYCHFLSQWLKNFKYYGIEIKGGESEILMSEANNQIGHDPRVEFGLIGDSIESKSISESNVILLGSIYTHLKFETFVDLNDKFLPVIDRGGIIIFSILLSEKYKVVGSGGAYGVKDCYGVAYYKKDMLDDYISNCNKYILRDMDTFLAQETYLHTIYRMELRK